MMIHGRFNNKMRFLFPGVNDTLEFLDCFVDSTNESEPIITISSELFNSSIC